MWGAKKDDGENYCTVFYYKLTDKGRSECRNNATPAVRAYKEFVQHVASESFHGRFKAIPRVDNSEECSLNGFLKKLLKTYNMKPFLTGPHCHGFTVRKGYMQVDIDVFHFQFLARKAAFGFFATLKTMILNVAFLVESQEDEDLPEQVLGCTRINNCDILSFKSISEVRQQLIKEGKMKAIT